MSRVDCSCICDDAVIYCNTLSLQARKKGDHNEASRLLHEALYWSDLSLEIDEGKPLTRELKFFLCAMQKRISVVPAAQIFKRNNAVSVGRIGSWS